MPRESQVECLSAIEARQCREIQPRLSGGHQHDVASRDALIVNPAQPGVVAPLEDGLRSQGRLSSRRSRRRRPLAIRTRFAATCAHIHEELRRDVGDGGLSCTGGFGRVHGRREAHARRSLRRWRRGHARLWQHECWRVVQDAGRSEGGRGGDGRSRGRQAGEQGGEATKEAAGARCRQCRGGGSRGG